jgi:pimeloyl-ACP methyl ester carboxylesterase
MVQVLLLAYFGVLFAAMLWSLVRRAVAFVRSRLSKHGQFSWTVPTEPSVVVTLVHGTWAQSATWVLPNSALCRMLTETWGGRIALMPLRWSGGNTVRARARAAADLATHIDAVARRFPASNHYVIAHSHGGNVALYALRQRSSVRISGLACLSTPFLHVRNRNLGQVSISSISAGMFISALIVVQTLLERQFAWTEDGALFAGLSTAAVLTALFHVGSQRLAGPTLAACSLPTSIDTDLLLIRTTGDEASSALAAAHFASWLAKRLWNFPASVLRDGYGSVQAWRRPAVGVLKWLTIPAAVCVAVALSMEPAAIDSGRPLAYTFQRVAAVAFFVWLSSLAVLWVSAGGTALHYLFSLILAGLITGPLALVLAILTMPFGPELALTCTRLELTAEAVPPGTHTVHHLPDRPSTQEGALLLDHSRSYDDPAAIDLIVNWIDGHQRSRRTSF